MFPEQISEKPVTVKKQYVIGKINNIKPEQCKILKVARKVTPKCRHFILDNGQWICAEVPAGSSQYFTEIFDAVILRHCIRRLPVTLYQDVYNNAFIKFSDNEERIRVLLLD